MESKMMRILSIASISNKNIKTYLNIYENYYLVSVKEIMERLKTVSASTVVLKGILYSQQCSL